MLPRDLNPFLPSPLLEGVFLRSLHSSTVVVEMKYGAGEGLFLPKIKGKPVGVLVGGAIAGPAIGGSGPVNNDPIVSAGGDPAVSIVKRCARLGKSASLRVGVECDVAGWSRSGTIGALQWAPCFKLGEA